MSIELHCPNCNKLIRAPDGAGGKRGKCPSCQQTVYIPSPPEETEEIPLAPIDESEQEREERLREETARYTAALDHEEGGEGGADLPEEFTESPGEVVDIPAEIEEFVIAMHESRLEEAEQVVSRLNSVKTRARDYAEGLMLDQMPPQIGDVPPVLLKGFLKNLVERLS